MKVLYVTYSCSPYNGSEDKIGWNIPWHMKNYVEKVWVVTKLEQKQYIDKFFKENNIVNENIVFCYVDIPNIFKKIYQGPIASGRQKIWLKKAFEIISNLVKENKIDIIHQITPVEFRSIGNFGVIPNIKYFVGPIGGGEYAPKTLKKYINKHFFVELMRRFENNKSLKLYYHNKLFDNISNVYVINDETKQMLSPLVKNTCVTELIDIGIDENECIDSAKLNKTFSKSITFLVSGRLVYRKGHLFLMKALTLISNEYDYKVIVMGDGSERKALKKFVFHNNLQNKVIFLGKLSYEKAQKEYAKADVLIVPSIRETTGTIFAEALSKGLPVITSNHYGGSKIINEFNGWKYNIDNGIPEINLANAIKQCIDNYYLLNQKSKNAINSSYSLLWTNKIKIFLNDYMNCVRL